MKEKVKTVIATMVSALVMLAVLLTVTNKEQTKNIKYTKEAYSSPFSITDNYDKVRGEYATNAYGRIFAKESEITDPYADHVTVTQSYTITAHPNGVSEYNENNGGYTQIELPEYLSIEDYIKMMN